MRPLSRYIIGRNLMIHKKAKKIKTNKTVISPPHSQNTDKHTQTFIARRKTQ